MPDAAGHRVQLHRDRHEHPASIPTDRLCFQAKARLGSFLLDAAFDVPTGTTVAMVGPSGSGKTACLSLIAGLLRAETAAISLNGIVLHDTAARIDLPPERRRVGLLFQDYALFPHLTVSENIGYGPAARSRGRRESEEITRRWTAQLGLAGMEDRAISSLSGGQRQRVALARALASDARLLLLDEPFAALDVASRSRARGELSAFLETTGLTTIVVSHDPVDAFVFGDRIIVLEEGRVTQSGSRDDLLRHPRSDFVAEFAGLNAIRAEVPAGTGLKEARAGSVVFHVLADALSGNVFLAFAPSEVALSIERPTGSPRNIFQGRVVETLSLPDRIRVLLDIGTPISAEITRDAGAALGLAEGRLLWAAVKATAIHVYA